MSSPDVSPSDAVTVRRATAEDQLLLQQVPSAATFGGDEAIVVFEKANLAAFLIWQRLAEDQLEVLQVETLAPYRRRGYARRLLQTLKEQEAGDMFLEVRQSNEAARQLYAREGFTEIGVRREYYLSPPEDAIVLRFHPC